MVILPKKLRLKKRLIVILLGLALAIFLLILREAGADEIWEIFVSQAQPLAIWKGTLSELHGPFHYFFLHWLGLLIPGGITIFTMRLCALFFGLLGALAVSRLTAQVSSTKAGSITLMLAFFLPAALWSAVFGRYYSFLILLSSLFLSFALQLIKERRVSYWGKLLVVAVIGVYTHYYFIFLVLALGMLLGSLQQYRLLFRQWLLFSLVLLILWSPALFAFFTLPKPEVVGVSNNLLKIPAVFVAFFVPWESLIFYYYHFQWVYLLVLAGLVFSGWWLSYMGWQRLKTPVRRLFLLVLFLPLIVVLLVSYLYQPFLGVTCFLIFLPVCLVCLSQGIVTAWPKKSWLVVSFGLFLLLNLGLLIKLSFNRPSREIFLEIQQEEQPNDLFLHANIYTFVMAKYYLGASQNFAIIDSLESQFTQQALGYQVINFDKIVAHQGKIWYFEPYFYDVVEASQFPAIMDKDFILLSKRYIKNGDFNLYLYQKR